MYFPDYRPRRLRRTGVLRRMVRETVLSVDDLIYPMFVVPGSGFSAPELGTPNPEPRTLNPDPGTLNPAPGTLNPAPGTSNPAPYQSTSTSFDRTMSASRASAIARGMALNVKR